MRSVQNLYPIFGHVVARKKMANKNAKIVEESVNETHGPGRPIAASERTRTPKRARDWTDSLGEGLDLCVCDGAVHELLPEMSLHPVRRLLPPVRLQQPFLLHQAPELDNLLGQK